MRTSNQYYYIVINFKWSSDRQPKPKPLHHLPLFPQDYYNVNVLPAVKTLRQMVNVARNGSYYNVILKTRLNIHKCRQ